MRLSSPIFELPEIILSCLFPWLLFEEFALNYSPMMVVLLSSKCKGMFKICENFSIFFSENEHVFSFIMSSKVLVM